MVSSQLENSARISACATEPPRLGDYQLAIVVVGLRDISGNTRVLAGALAGSSRIEVESTLVRVGSDHQIFESEFGHKTPVGFRWSDGAETFVHAAAVRVAEDIVAATVSELE
jgi:hypothetical protein